MATGQVQVCDRCGKVPHPEYAVTLQDEYLCGPCIQGEHDALRVIFVEFTCADHLDVALFENTRDFIVAAVNSHASLVAACEAAALPLKDAQCEDGCVVASAAQATPLSAWTPW